MGKLGPAIHQYPALEVNMRLSKRAGVPPRQAPRDGHCALPNPSAGHDAVCSRLGRSSAGADK